MYSIASAYFEPQHPIIAFEIDPDAIKVAKENLEHYEIDEDECQIMNVDLLKEFGEESES